jgi:hypothetical protein
MFIGVLALCLPTPPTPAQLPELHRLYLPISGFLATRDVRGPPSYLPESPYTTTGPHMPASFCPLWTLLILADLIFT